MMHQVNNTFPVTDYIIDDADLVNQGILLPNKEVHPVVDPIKPIPVKLAPLKPAEVDKVEDLTLRMFTHFQTIADRIPRSAIEAAIGENLAKNQDGVQKKQEVQQVQDGAKNLDSPNLDYVQFRPFGNETNFEWGIFNQNHHNSQIGELTSTIFRILKDIFFGGDPTISNLRHKDLDHRTPDEMGKMLITDHTIWNCEMGLKDSYSEYFRSKMTHIFSQARDLLLGRKRYARNHFYQRITFYALLVITTCGKLMNQKVLQTSGLIFSAVTLFWMIKDYRSYFFKQRDQIHKLKSDLEEAYKEAPANRIK